MTLTIPSPRYDVSFEVPPLTLTIPSPRYDMAFEVPPLTCPYDIAIESLLLIFEAF
ncbi:hypothetical protein OWR29_23350 [Actinoplanes sp. Pm04-4]|uniref:Uncharacterized protein n=1 Tax=Paractinoplanes pyxinae TaxID=2997416 RepID=A0ABT4B391_9ACTN|nr:hypothetical protein [Actinoplanes pyxinae]MCY1140945.1 hypothetical protein [Actinoplanes pyxinae]